MQNIAGKDVLFYDSVAYDDSTLIALYKEARANFKRRRSFLETKRLNERMDDYLSVTIARLQYQIVKEEHDLLLKEMMKRGISITITN
jgi:hypothetical protein